MQRVSLRKAVEILQMQGIEVSWDENLNLDDFFSYFDQHYAPKLEESRTYTPIGDIGEFFTMDIFQIFK